ncbi:MAG: RluA family pseudouridine synthase, partial [Pseudolabrys sp.]
MADVVTETVMIGAGEAGLRLDRVLAAHLAHLSRSRLKALILAGQVTIAGRTIRDPATSVKSGDLVKVALLPPEPATPQGEDITLNIVYEDDAIVVIDKPKDLVVHPAAGHASGTLVNALIAHCGDSLSGIGGVKRPGIVHRLDKDTTGLMVVAKTDKAHRALAEQFVEKGEGPLRRGYLAIVWGAPGKPKGTIDAPLGRHPQSRNKQAVRGNGRAAVTHWQVLERFTPPGAKTPIASLLACTLETGRTHQIRVHLAHLGHPILGDATYGTGFGTKASLLAPKARDALS